MVMKEYVVKICLGPFKKIKSFGVDGFSSDDAEWAAVVRLAHRHARELLEILKSSHGLEGLPDGDVKIERIN